VKALRQILPFSLVAVVGLSACTKDVKLDDQKKKMSYAIGQQIGESIKSQGLAVDADVLAVSIKDVMAGQKSRLTPEEMQATMMAAQQEMITKQAAEGEANAKKGADFLAANKAKEGVVTTPSGLQYKVVTPGKGATPKDSDSVVCHYKGTLIDGTEFDSSLAQRAGGIPGERRHRGLDRSPQDDEGRRKAPALHPFGSCLRTARPPGHSPELRSAFRHRAHLG